MEVILLEKIRKLGSLGEKVKVKAGYARNYLVPNQKAVLATVENIETFEEQRLELESRAQTQLQEAQERAQKLDAMATTISVNASEEGKLYGSIGPREISVAITKAGELVAKQEVEMPEGPINELGEYEVTLRVHTDVTAVVKIVVEAAK